MSSQSQKAFGTGLSGLIGLALDCDLSRSEIADELRRAVEPLSPSHGVRFAQATDERMPIDPDPRCLRRQTIRHLKSPVS